MTSNSGRRLDRLLPALSAQERAILILRDFKAEKPQDRQLLNTASERQTPEINHLIGLMNAVNCELTFSLMLICAQVTQVEIKHGWLMSMALCIDEVQMLGYAILQETNDAKLRRRVKQLIARGPGQVESPVETPDSEGRKDGEHTIDWLLRSLVTAIKTGTEQNWRELRAIDMAVEEVAEEFGGEDPLRADGRALLDEGKARCRQLHEDIRFFVEPFELPEPGEADVELVRRLIARAARA